MAMLLGIVVVVAAATVAFLTELADTRYFIGAALVLIVTGCAYVMSRDNFVSLSVSWMAILLGFALLITTVVYLRS